MLVIPPDVEDELRKWFPAALTGAGETAAAAFAGSTPRDLAGHSATFMQTGGGQIAVNVYRVQMSVDFRATTEGEAVRLARVGAGLLSALAETETAGTLTVTQVTPMSLPYLNPDPRNPQLHRVSYNAALVVKGEIVG